MSERVHHAVAAMAGADSHPTRTRTVSGPDSLVVICTKQRPNEVAMSCAAVHRASPDTPILVFDASTSDATREVCENLVRSADQSLTLLYRRAGRPGLARQRNEAIGICRHMGVQIVHFIDDDTEVCPGYFDAIDARFQNEPDVIAVGGIVVNQPAVHYVWLKALFLLASGKRGTVLRSGRNMMGQYPGTSATEPVNWLCGCSMSFRTAVFDEFAFDDEMTGYSIGEDYDFTFRVSRKHRIAIEPAAECVHHFTPTMRGSRRGHARMRTEATHRWVSRHRTLGMSLAAFWWSALGDFLLTLGYGITHLKREYLREALGVIDGAVAAVKATPQRRDRS
jgi:GT2 family glycosyltransferase